MAQQQALGALDVVVPDIVREGAVVLEHLPGDGLGTDVLRAHPGMLVGEIVEGAVDELPLGFWVFHLLQLGDALVVFDALLLHLGHPLGLQTVQLFPQDDVRVLEDGFHQSDHVQGVVRGLGIQQGQGVQKVERERLVHGKVVLQRHVDPQLRFSLGMELHDPAIHQGAEELPGPFAVGVLGLLGIVAGPDQPLHGPAAVALAGEHIEQHAVGYLEAGHQPLGLGDEEALEGLFVPVHEVAVRGLALHELLPGLQGQLGVLDGILRGLGHHPAQVVEALAACPSGDLMEVPGAEDAGLLAVVLAELGEEHRADGDVDAHPERVRAADDLEQAFLGQPLHEDAVLGQESRVVEPDAVAQPALEVRPVGAVELAALQGLGDGGLLFPGADVDAGEVLSAGGGIQLGEVDHIDRGLALQHQLFHGERQGRFRVRKGQRYRPFLGLHRHRGQAVEACQLLLEETGIAQGRRHEQEACPGHGEEGRLPGHAPLTVCVVVEFVHDHVLDVDVGALPQGQVGEDLRRAAEDGRVTVDGGIACGEPHILGPELPAEVEPLLVHQCLDGAGVDRPPPLSQGPEVQRRRHQRFPRACGCVQDDVLPLEDLQDGRLLGRVEPEPLALRVVQEPPQQSI